MPVLVTGAHRPLARRIALALLELGGEVRAHGPGDLHALKAAGAIAAHGDGDDEGHLDASLAQVHTAVHVGRGLFAPSPEVLRAEASALTRAAANAAIARIVALSVPGADPDASDPLRATYGQIEALLADCPVPSVVVRASLVDTPATRDALATAGLAADELATPVAPVRVDDLVRLVVAFDDLRSSASTGHAVLAADGPRTMTVGDYLATVGAGRPGTGSLVGRRALDPDQVPLLLPSLRGPWTTDADGDRYPDAWRFAEVPPRSPGDA